MPKGEIFYHAMVSSIMACGQRKNFIFYKKCRLAMLNDSKVLFGVVKEVHPHERPNYNVPSFVISN